MTHYSSLPGYKKTYVAMEYLVLVLFCSLNCGFSIKLENNGYTGIVVTISDRIPEDPVFLTKIKEWLTEASKRLYIATKNQLYLREITIRVPLNWTNHGHYSTVTESSIKEDHVKISDELDRPFTFGVIQCGQGGQFIYFPPKVILEGNSGRFGDIGMVFVHEWGHFRWGLFDEYPTLIDRENRNTKQSFYRYNGTWEAVRCTNQIQGKTENIHTKEDCLNGPDGKPEADCIFIPYTDHRGKAQASIMGHSYVPSVSQFCDDTPNNPETHHNKYSLNEHNVRCNWTSSWEIMRLHEDFKNISDNNPDQDTKPTFKLVQTVPDRICLAIDVSVSMASVIKPTYSAVVSLIRYILPNNSFFEIVKFSDNATMIKEMTEISTDSDRDKLISYIPSTTGGATAIGAGLLMGLQALSALQTTSGSIIYLATDGDENKNPVIEDVLPTLVNRGVIVHTLAISASADSKLANIASATGGSSFFFSQSVANSTVLIDALSQPFVDSEMDPIIRIFSASVSSSENEAFKTSFYIDDSIGRDTVIQFAANDVSGTRLTVTSEDTGYTTTGTSVDPGIMAVKLPGKATVGKYIISVTSAKSISGTLAAQSKAVEIGSNILQMKAWTTTRDLNYTVAVQFPIFVSILYGYAPVTNAIVKVLIENKAGKTSSLILRDNAVGADIIAHDGIYSGFVLSNLISNNGRHSFKIVAEGVNSSIVVPKLSAPGIGDENIPLMEDPITPFMRVALAKEVIVTNYQPTYSSVDLIPPSAIKTLFLSNVSNHNNTFTVTWKAVGDDYDTGRAFRYELRKSKNFSELVDNPDEQETILIGLTPSEAGNVETFTLEGMKEKETYFIAIRAVDENNNTGEISNIISVSILSYDSPWIKHTSVPEVVNEHPDNSKDMVVYGLVLGAVALVIIALAIFAFVFHRKRNEKSYNLSI